MTHYFNIMSGYQRTCDCTLSLAAATLTHARMLMSLVLIKMA